MNFGFSSKFEDRYGAFIDIFIYQFHRYSNYYKLVKGHTKSYIKVIFLFDILLEYHTYTDAFPHKTKKVSVRSTDTFFMGFDLS